MTTGFSKVIKTDNKNILSFVLAKVHFTILDILTNPNSNKLPQFFNNLEEKIKTENFIQLIPAILTDKDHLLQI